MAYTLADSLAARTWCNLRAMAHAHGLRFNTNHTKQQARERLFRELAGGQFKRSFRTLAQPERKALVALQAAGGAMALYRFTAAFGPIRPYRPWRDDAPPHPWRRPVSPAERLWFLGFITILKGENGRPRTVHAAAEGLALLPPLPRPRARARRLPRSHLSPDVLRVDVAALIGTLLGERARPRWHRWLPPHTLKAINARLRVPETIPGVRSELHTRRLRFLHYLAETAGLVALQGQAILPTAAAWTWLDLPPGEQWRWLWDAWTRDLNARDPLGKVYRFPAISGEVWAALAGQFRQLMPGRTYTIPSLLDALRPFVLDDKTLDAVPAVLRGPLRWAGIVTAAPGQFAVTAEGSRALRGEDTAFAAPDRARIIASPESIRLDLPDVPPLRALGELFAWATVDPAGVQVDEEAVARAVSQGYDAAQIAGVLARLTGGPLPTALLDQIAHWERRRRQLVLRTMTVLTSPDADLLARLRQDRALREMFAEPLSAHHAAVFPHADEPLRQRLERRGFPVTAVLAPTLPEPGGSLSPSTAEYVWLAVQVYRDLGAFIPLPVRIPAAVLDEPGACLADARADALVQTAAAVRESLARTLAGVSALPAPAVTDDPATIRAAVQAAYEQQGTLTIEYFSPAYGAPAIRTLAPITPITESGGAEYVEAWCHTADAARTFRLDRMLRLVETPPGFRAETGLRIDGLPSTIFDGTVFGSDAPEGPPGRPNRAAGQK